MGRLEGKIQLVLTEKYKIAVPELDFMCIWRWHGKKQPSLEGL